MRASVAGTAAWGQRRAPSRQGRKGRRKEKSGVTDLLCVVLILAGSSATADDKGKPALSGVWAKKGGEMKIEFGDKGMLKLLPHGDKAGIVILCKYTLEKDG